MVYIVTYQPLANVTCLLGEISYGSPHWSPHGSSFYNLIIWSYMQYILDALSFRANVGGKDHLASDSVWHKTFE